MRRRLMAAAAMAPLMLGFQVAHAQNPILTISSDTSTPVATATAVSGGPGDIDLNSGVTFTIKDTNPALTLNSNNAITNSGTITSNNLNGATGILIQGPFTGNVFNEGTINLTESYAPSTDSSTSLTVAPYAQGQNRIGIRVTGPLTGTINNGAAIVIQGNNSTGISIESTVTAAAAAAGADAVPPVAVGGTLTITGDNSFGVLTTSAGQLVGAANNDTNPVTTGLTITGSITVKGQNSVAVQTNAPINGALTVYGVISTTGYAITTRETGQLLTNIEKTPTELEQGGSALQVRGDVTGGVFLGAPPTGTVSGSTTTDGDLDGIVDGSEGSANLTTYGSAPTVQIGSPVGPINLGNFGAADSANPTDNNAFGLIVEGTVSAQGVWDTISATAIDIGAGGNGVNLNGGIRVAGAVGAAAYEANATAIHLEPGVTAGLLLNTGTISATVTSAGANTATALQIDAGSTLTAINNVNAITAATTGDAASAKAVVDNGGGVTSVTNYGYIEANRTPALPGEALTGSAVALDLHLNTTGVTLQQLSNTTNAPIILGDVLLGSGPNTVDLEIGSLTGTLSMGAAPSSLTINGGAVYRGQLEYSATGQLAIDVQNGTLQDNSATAVGASSLHVGATSILGFALDPAHNTSTLFNVSGAATFDAGATITATVLSPPSLTGQTFTVVKAGSLSVGTLDSALLTSLPYLFNGSVHTDTIADTISLTIVPKTPVQLGFNKAETAAFSAIYADLPQDSSVQSVILGAPTRPSLVSAYDQLLPNSSGDVFNTVFGMSRAVSRAAADRFDFMTQQSDDEEDDDLSTTGFWASEFYSGLWQNKVDNNAYHAAGLGVIGGYDFGGTGFTLSAGSSNVTQPGQSGDSLNAVSIFEAGFYASPRFGALSIDARVGAGYLFVSNRRQLAASYVSSDLSTTTNVTRTAKGVWGGYDFSGHLGAGLELDATKHLFFQPKIYADVFHVHENGYSERSGQPTSYGPGYDFNVSQRDSTQTNGTASLVTGLKFGNLFVVSPQLEVGYDKVLTGGPGATTARFAYGGSAFTVPANQIGGAATGRLTIRGDGNYVHFSLQGGGEYSSSYHSLDAKAVFRLTF